VKRTRRLLHTTSLIAAGLVAVVVVDPLARAHGGEDHGAPAKPSAAPAQDPGSARLPIETQFLLGLRTERVKRGTLATSAGQVGTAVARPTGDLVIVAPTSGRIFPPDGGFIRLGDEVKKGQVLGSFRPSLSGAESAQLGLSRSDATGRLSSAEARLTLAERELQRRRELDGIVAKKDVQAAEAEVEVARSDLLRARADVGSLAGSAGAQKLVSTLEGTVVAGQVSPGATVASGAEIWRIVDLSTLWIDVRVPEADAARLTGSRAEMSLVVDRAVQFTGQRFATGSLIDPATRTVQALFEVDNKDHRVRVGSLVNVSLTTGARMETVVIPSSALLDRSGTPVVIVKTAPEAFEVRAVAVGPRAGASTGIQAGVRAGERVVVDGAMSVLLAAGG
jgi:RND family efflux transporter MFP subunit